jgi:hypothetical protein
MKEQKHLTFCIQKHDEVVKKVLRRGFIIELPWVLGVLASSVLLIIFPFVTSASFTDKNLLGITTFVIINLLFFLGLYTFNRLINWFYSVNIITDQRLIDFEFSDLGHKNIVECRLENIQSITLQNQGLLSFLFRLSTIKVLTSGDNPNVDFEFIENPTKTQNLISDLTKIAQGRDK